ncbi:unnamed protein product [Sphenostylis stenocarpa]|uniref:Dolichyl-diphosphooligosaccharide--protein glycosyltransferase subunit 4 n=1 Tax=Sphenostylis stenocarpa TaxID=92480 RepID=A0AA86V302_9FABA|nr:unnamed protein product [Sphenostylis stenocarpa]
MVNQMNTTVFLLFVLDLGTGRSTTAKSWEARRQHSPEGKVTPPSTASEGYLHVLILLTAMLQMIDDQDLGFFANFLGVFIFVLVIAYHFVMADPKFEGN